MAFCPFADTEKKTAFVYFPYGSMKKVSSDFANWIKAFNLFFVSSFMFFLLFYNFLLFSKTRLRPATLVVGYSRISLSRQTQGPRCAGPPCILPLASLFSGLRLHDSISLLMSALSGRTFHPYTGIRYPA